MRTQYDDDKIRRTYISGGPDVRAGVVIHHFQGGYSRYCCALWWRVGFVSSWGSYGHGVCIGGDIAWLWFLRSRWLHVAVEPPYLQPFVHWKVFEVVVW